MTASKPTNYETRRSDDGWKATEASIEKPATSYYAPGYCYVILNGKSTAPGTLTSPVIQGGLSALVFYLSMPCQDFCVECELTIWCCDTIAYKDTIGSCEMSQYQTYMWYNLFDLQGDIKIQFRNTSPTYSHDNADRLALYNIQWISYIEPPVIPDGPYDVNEDTVLCAQDMPYYWPHGNSKKCPIAGKYHYTLIGSLGQDSIYYHLDVGVQERMRDTHETVHLQQGQSYTWAETGVTYTPDVTTDYEQIITYQQPPQCDSIVKHLHLIVDPPTIEPAKGETTIYICYGDSVEVHGRWLSVQNTYRDTLVGAASTGGDSIVDIHLVVHDAPMQYRIDTTICEGTICQWHGMTLRKDGTYFEHIKSQTTGCDSVIYSLRLHTKPCPQPCQPTYSTTAIIKKREELPIEWNGHTLTSDTVVTYSTINQAGCDSVATMKMHVVEPCGIPTRINDMIINTK